MLSGSSMSRLWNRLFLGERPSIMLAFFRIAMAAAIGLHVIPTFLQLNDNYLHTAFKETNPSFFTPEAIRLVAQSPDAVVLAFVALFLVSWFCFLIGFRTQPSAILVMISSYYFYALNSLHIGTLSWDILLVTFFLLCITDYPGDYFSVDSLRKGNAESYRRARPYFIQRLLQLQMSATYFYTALAKISSRGNWLSENPWWYLMNEPAGSVVKEFWLRPFLAARPDLCYAIGISVIVMEFSLSVLWFLPKIRIGAIFIGWVFHVLLLWTLHVPTIFFFLFPPQMLLFIDPRNITRWIDQKREKAKCRGRAKLIFDGNCHFCRESVRMLLVLDLFGYLETVDFNQWKTEDFPAGLDCDICKLEIKLAEPDGTISGGFFAFRRLALKLPLLYPCAPLLYLPGAAFLGVRAYEWVAKHRYLFR